jgi:UMP-CMP kinase
MDATSKPKVILVFGGPGAGKGTQCNFIQSNFGHIHLSIGDILRSERKKDTELGKKLDELEKSYEATGQYFSPEIPIKILKQTMIDAGWSQKVFLIDGWHKNKATNDFWISELESLVDVVLGIWYDCSEETMKKRIIERANSSQQRVSDTEEIAVRRVNTFLKETVPIYQTYETKYNIVKLNAEQDVAAVFNDTKLLINKNGFLETK